MKRPGVARCARPSALPTTSASGSWVAAVWNSACICESILKRGLAEQVPLLAQLGCKIRVAGARAICVGLREQPDVTRPLVVPAWIIQARIEADAFDGD